ncbi:helix-turn-helix domain-containing protein [Nanoarchaeota archaeon]
MLSKDVLAGLFDDKRLKVLRLFISRPEEDFYLREAARAARVPPATVYRILNQFVELELLKMTKIKKTKLYKLADNPKVEALRELFEEKKTAIQEFIEYVSVLPNVERIILHGKPEKDKANLLVIGGDLPTGKIKEKVGDIKAKYNISIIDLTLTPDQFKQMSVMGLFPGTKKTLWPV